MIPATQYRTGENGTCFRSCVASILNMPEHQVLDFDKDTNGSLEKYWRNVGSFLARYGLRYFRVPIGGAKPVGWSTIEGISPRGGPHACVAYNGKLVHDPHPQDGTGRGLVEPRYYGVLRPLAGGKAKDAKHDRIDSEGAWKRTVASRWPAARVKATSYGYAAYLHAKNGDVRRIGEFERDANLGHVLEKPSAGKAKDADASALRQGDSLRLTQDVQVTVNGRKRQWRSGKKFWVVSCSTDPARKQGMLQVAPEGSNTGAAITVTNQHLHDWFA